MASIAPIDEDLLDDDNEDLPEDEENGIFDDADDIFEGDAKASPQESVFTDKPSIFSTPHSRDAIQQNPLTSRQAEVARYETALKSPPAGSSKLLVAKFDEQSQPIVAVHEDGKALERWRRPTAQEYDALKVNGKIIKGGIGSVPAVAPVGGVAALPWKKIALALGVVGAGGAAYWYWRKRRRKAKAD
jgi:hypothetical protein